MTAAGSKASVESNIDELYSLAPEEFIAARDRLAKQLKDDGNADVSKRVKSLRRPSVPAWAVNQIARGRQGELNELLAAGEDLRRAQQRALSGKGGGDLREAGERRRRALQALVEATDALLNESGHAAAGHLDAVRNSFEAASIDRDAAARVREGRLTKELDAPAGFGDVSGLTLVPTGDTAGAKRTARQAKEEEKRRSEQKRQAEEAKARAAELKREADRAEREAARAAREAERARAEAIRLRKLAEEARQKAGRYSRA